MYKVWLHVVCFGLLPHKYVMFRKKNLLTVTASDWYLRLHVYQSSDIRARVLQLVVPGSGVTYAIM